MTPRGRGVLREVEGSPLLASPAVHFSRVPSAASVERCAGRLCRRSLSTGSLPVTSTPSSVRAVTSSTCASSTGAGDLTAGRGCGAGPWPATAAAGVCGLEGLHQLLLDGGLEEGASITQGASGVVAGGRHQHLAAPLRDDTFLASPAAPPPWAQRFSQGDTPPLSKLLETPPRRQAWQASASSVGLGVFDLKIPPWPIGGASTAGDLLPPPLPRYSEPPRPPRGLDRYKLADGDRDEQDTLSLDRNGFCCLPPRLPGRPARVSRAAEELLVIEQEEEIARFLGQLEASKAISLPPGSGDREPSEHTCSSRACSSTSRSPPSSPLPSKLPEQQHSPAAVTPPSAMTTAASAVTTTPLDFGRSRSNSSDDPLRGDHGAADAAGPPVGARADSVADERTPLECHERRGVEGEGNSVGASAGGGCRGIAVESAAAAEPLSGDDARPLHGTTSSFGEPASAWFASDEAVRLPCRCCGRYFLESRLAFHEDVCGRASSSSRLTRRAVFDSRRQRLAGVRDGRWWADGSGDATSWPAPDPKLGAGNATANGRSASAPSLQSPSRGTAAAASAPGAGRHPPASLERTVPRRHEHTPCRRARRISEAPATTPPSHWKAAMAASSSTALSLAATVPRPATRPSAAKSAVHVGSRSAAVTASKGGGGRGCGGGRGSLASSPPARSPPAAALAAGVGKSRAVSGRRPLPAHIGRQPPQGGEGSATLRSRTRAPSRPDRRSCKGQEQTPSVAVLAQPPRPRSPPPSVAADAARANVGGGGGDGGGAGRGAHVATTCGSGGSPQRARLCRSTAPMEAACASKLRAEPLLTLATVVAGAGAAAAIAAAAESETCPSSDDAAASATASGAGVGLSPLADATSAANLLVSDSVSGLSIGRRSDDSLLGPMMREVAQLGAQVDELIARRQRLLGSGAAAAGGGGGSAEDGSVAFDRQVEEALSPAAAGNETFGVARTAAGGAAAAAPAEAQAVSKTSVGARAGASSAATPVHHSYFIGLGAAVAGGGGGMLVGAALCADSGASSSWRPYDPQRYCAQDNDLNAAEGCCMSAEPSVPPRRGSPTSVSPPERLLSTAAAGCRLGVGDCGRGVPESFYIGTPTSEPGATSELGAARAGGRGGDVASGAGGGGGGAGGGCASCSSSRNSSSSRDHFRDAGLARSTDESESCPLSGMMDSLERQSLLFQDRIRGCAKQIRQRRDQV